MKIFLKMILLLNRDDKECHYLPLKNISTLLHGIARKHGGDWYFINYLHSLEHKANCKLKSNESLCENHKYFNVKMPEAHN